MLCVGVTVTLPTAAGPTSPTPWSIRTDAAPAAFHEIVTGCPGSGAAGEAAQASDIPPGTLTLTAREYDWPPYGPSASTMKIRLVPSAGVTMLPVQVLPLHESATSGVVEFSGSVTSEKVLPLFGPLKLSFTGWP